MAKRLCRMIPDGIGTYYEPFLGGGSLFFAAAPRLAILSDLNARLIETYQMLKSDPDAIIKILTQWANDTVTYYKIRESNYTKRTFRAAQLIYLNRTCWNGLYRVNQAGRFNVPFGNHGRSIFDRSHVLEVANALKNATLLTGDFADMPRSLPVISQTLWQRRVAGILFTLIHPTRPLMAIADSVSTTKVCLLGETRSALGTLL